ncbi:MAG: acyltransferase [Lachnospiraceae bacterium]|nr:acyltransferase [Lachnospiraceae bacterium]
MSTSFYTADELKNIGFASYGQDVLISRKASIYSSDRISLGNHVRIDDFCILSGKITLGDHIHISAYTGMFGGNEGIIMEDYATISSRCAIYAISDDYSGEFMTNPMVPEQYTSVTDEKVKIGMCTIIGTGSTILPGVECGEGVAVGAMSLVNRSLDAWKMYAGIPCRYIKDRSKELLKYEKMLREKEKIDG